MFRLFKNLTVFVVRQNRKKNFNVLKFPQIHLPKHISVATTPRDLSLIHYLFSPSKIKIEAFFFLSPMKSKIYHQQNSNNSVVGSDNGCRSESPSPPLSPNRRVPRRQRRQTLFRASSFSFRRKLRYLLLLPMIYASGLLMCVGPFSGLVGWVYVPGSVYRSPEIYRKLRDDIFADNSTDVEVFYSKKNPFFFSFCFLILYVNASFCLWNQLSSVWKYKRRPKMQKPCPNSTVTSHLALNGGKEPNQFP